MSSSSYWGIKSYNFSILLLSLFIQFPSSKNGNILLVAAYEIPIGISFDSFSKEHIPQYYDENGKLNSNLLLYPESCSAIMEDYYFSGDFLDTHQNLGYGRNIHPISGDAEKRIFGKMAPTNPRGMEDCNAVCVQRGVDEKLASYVMPHFYYRDIKNEEVYDYEEPDRITDEKGENLAFTAWYFEQCQKVEFVYTNYHKPDHFVNVYWVNPVTNALIFNRELHYGDKQTTYIGSFLGHQFVFEDPETREILVDHTIEFAGAMAIGTYFISEEQRQRAFETERDAVKEILEREWDRHFRVKRTFTSVGFTKGKLPKDLYSEMSSYYYNSRKYKYAEETIVMTSYINWWESDLFFVQIPWSLKLVWQKRLLDLVQEWVGPDVPLEQSDLYGIREYTHGARLLSHVDREQTHAASLIINIAQENMIEPWRVDIHDHADRLHEVVMEAGEIVYYESAKCLHGRNTPLQGQYYANLFTHYFPVGDNDWYLKDNPDGAPEPLIDVGECKLAGPSDVYSKGSAQCDNHRIGPHLSPKLFTAKNADDMYHFWESVGPEQQQQQQICNQEKGENCSSKVYDGSEL